MLILALLIVALLAAGVGLRWWTWRPVIKKRVMVQIIDGPSIGGVCVSKRGPLLVLDDVTVHTGTEQRPADGQTVIDRSHVLWMQVMR